MNQTFLIAVCWLCLLTIFVPQALLKVGMTRPNFQSRQIPVGLGLIIFFWSIPFLFYRAIVSHEQRYEALAMAAVCTIFGILGYIDDRYGDRSSTGLKGHIQALLKRKQITTGMLKLLIGSITAILIPHFVLQSHWLDSLLIGAIIALSANTMNLLDLRPGRCLSAFVFLSGIVWLLASDLEKSGLIGWLLPPAVAIYGMDRSARGMLGDTGSNLLGSALGLALTCSFPTLSLRLLFLALLVALHIVAERSSITKIIESNRILRTIDRLTGVR